LMLVFKDVILGFVAGIQLTANRMIARGDWVEMPKYGADGEVLELALTTVKIQNWDKTITTIPAYSLISESFKNWRGMSESGGRRIKRAIYIDMNTICYCTDDMIERFSKIQCLTSYIQGKKQELSEYNRNIAVDESVLINGRRLTNIGTFRAYIIEYLRQHPMINKEMTFIVRQLPPTEHGLPIEIYVFCSDKEWAKREGIVAFAGHPLIVEGRLVGVIAVFSRQAFPEHTIRTLASISNKIALGIENKSAEED